VGLNKNRPVYLRQVASVQDGPSTAKSYVSFYGKQMTTKSAQSEYPHHIRWKSQGSGCNENFGENF
jgi:hypothetical protein